MVFITHQVVLNCLLWQFRKSGCRHGISRLLFHSILLAKSNFRGSPDSRGGNGASCNGKKNMDLEGVKHQYTTDGKDVRENGKEDLLISTFEDNLKIYGFDFRW